MLRIKGCESGSKVSINGLMLTVSQDGLLVGSGFTLSDEQEQGIAENAANVYYESDGKTEEELPSDSASTEVEELSGSKDDYKKSQLLSALKVLGQESSKTMNKGELWSLLEGMVGDMGASIVEAALDVAK